MHAMLKMAYRQTASISNCMPKVSHWRVGESVIYLNKDDSFSPLWCLTKRVFTIKRGSVFRLVPVCPPFTLSDTFTSGLCDFALTKTPQLRRCEKSHLCTIERTENITHLVPDLRNVTD